MSQTINDHSTKRTANTELAINTPRTMGSLKMIKGLGRMKQTLTALIKTGAVVLLSAGFTLNAAATEISYYHTDHLGTPKAMTDESGNVVWQATHDAFGKAEITTEAVTNNLRFPGQYFDEETELHYNYFRTYDPNIGRYITSDPIGLGGGISTYGYVGGNPLRYSDPQGLLFDPTTTAATAAEAAATSAGVGISFAVAAGAGAVALLYPSPAGAGSDVVPEQCEREDCKELIANIRRTANELRSRYLELLYDRRELFTKARTMKNLGKRAGTYEGHRLKFRELQQVLSRLIFKADLLACPVFPIDRDLLTAKVPVAPVAR